MTVALNYFGFIGKASFDPQTSFFGGGVREFNAAEVRSDLAALPAGEDLVIRAMGLGGDYHESDAIAQAWEDEAVTRNVTIQVHGIAASAMAHAVLRPRGTTVQVSRGGQIMMHAPRFIGAGTAPELESSVTALRGISEATIAMVAERSPKLDTPSNRAILMGGAGEIWQTAAEATENGLVNGIIGEADPDAQELLKDADFAVFGQPLGEPAVLAMLSGPLQQQQEVAPMSEKTAEPDGGMVSAGVLSRVVSGLVNHFTTQAPAVQAVAGEPVEPAPVAPAPQPDVAANQRAVDANTRNIMAARMAMLPAQSAEDKTRTENQIRPFAAQVYAAQISGDAAAEAAADGQIAFVCRLVTGSAARSDGGPLTMSGTGAAAPAAVSQADEASSYNNARTAMIQRGGGDPAKVAAGRSVGYDLGEMVEAKNAEQKEVN